MPAVAANVLLDEVKCYACATGSVSQLLKLALLRRNVLAGNPSADVSLDGLMEYSKCYACFGFTQVELLELALLSQAAGGGSGDCENLEGADSPLNFVTPDFIGQVYVQSDGTIWQAGSLLNSSWTVIGSDILIATPSNQIGEVGIYSAGGSGISNVIWNSTESRNGGIAWSDDPDLITFSAPNLTSVDALNAGNAFFQITGNSVLTTLDFPVLTHFYYGDFYNNPLLTTINFPVWLPIDNVYDFSGNGLNAATVNSILARGIAAGVTNAIFILNGGTNAAPTGQGIIDKAALILAGNTVSTN